MMKREIFNKREVKCNYVAECPCCGMTSDDLPAIGLSCEICGLCFENDETMVCAYTTPDGDVNSVHFHKNCLEAEKNKEKKVV